MVAKLGGGMDKQGRLFFHLWIKIEHFLNWNVTGNTFGCDITLFFYLLKFIYEQEGVFLQLFFVVLFRLLVSYVIDTTSKYQFCKKLRKQICKDINSCYVATFKTLYGRLPMSIQIIIFSGMAYLEGSIIGYGCSKTSDQYRD